MKVTGGTGPTPGIQVPQETKPAAQSISNQTAGQSTAVQNDAFEAFQQQSPLGLGTDLPSLSQASQTGQATQGAFTSQSGSLFQLDAPKETAGEVGRGAVALSIMPPDFGGGNMAGTMFANNTSSSGWGGGVALSIMPPDFGGSWGIC